MGTARKHGMCNEAEYRIWCGIVTRCQNPNTRYWKYYGGRGISIAIEWLNNFPGFYAEVGPRPSPQHTIERIDNNKGYEPGNCRWATRVEQNNNRRNNVIVEYRGSRMTIGQAARAAGSIIGSDLAHNRITRYGWTVERAVESPPTFMRRKAG